MSHCDINLLLSLKYLVYVTYTSTLLFIFLFLSIGLGKFDRVDNIASCFPLFDNQTGPSSNPITDRQTITLF